MQRSVRTFLPVVGDPDAVAASFVDDPQRWLPAARHEGPGRYTFLLHAGALNRTVHAVVGSPWRAGTTRWRTLAWDPAPQEGDGGATDRLLPSLDGELGLHLEPSGRTTLVFDARYQPPGGPFGAAVDAVALHRIARGTVERFLEEVAARLASEALLVMDDEPTAAPHAPPPDGPATAPSAIRRNETSPDRHAPHDHGAAAGS